MAWRVVPALSWARHANSPGDLLCPRGGAGRGARRGCRRADSRGRHARRPQRADGGRGAVPGPRRSGEQLDQLAGRVAQGLARGGEARREHGERAHRLGAGRARGGTLRLLVPRHAPPRGPRAPPTPGPAVVRDLEEQRPELRARVGEARQRALPASPGREGQGAQLAVAARGGDAGRGPPGLRRAHAAPEGSGRPSHRDHGAGRERAGHVRQRPRFRPRGAAGVRGAGAGPAAAGARRQAGPLEQVFGPDADEIFHALVDRQVHRRRRRGRQGRVPAAPVRERRPARPLPSGHRRARTRAAAPPTT